VDIKGKERLHLKSSTVNSTRALCSDQVDWVDVSVDPQHLDDPNGDEDSASYCGKAFQIMEGIAIYHDNDMIHKWRGITLKNFKTFWFIYTVKLIQG
jgi:hypothetical protein